MAYKESYMKCETLEELQKEVAIDIKVATVINKDRIKMIEEAAKEVTESKFKDI
jgi:LPS O-antigen subunit length determinant protein (WzzB/FepE family)